MKRVLSALLLSTSLLVQSALPGALASPYEQQSLALTYPEKEPNDTPIDNQRYPLAGGENFVFTGNVSGEGFMEDLVDYFPFEVTKTGYMSVVLQETATANLLQMDIFDEYGNEIDDDNPNHLYEIHNVRLEQGRQYFVRVSVREGMFGSGFQYRLQVGFQAQAAPVDAFEPNNAKESAAQTTLGESPSGKLEGVIGSAEDQDWYRFDAAETGYFKLHLHSIPEGREYDFKLFNSDGTLIASTENRPGKIMHNVHGSAGQTFYVQVYSSMGFDLNDTYQLERIFTSGYDALSGDIHEWNNSLQTASVTTLGQMQSDVGQGTIHEPNDQDWYAVKLSQTGNFQVGLALAPSENYHIALYEADGDPLYSTEYYEEHEPKMLPLQYGKQGDSFYVKVFTTEQHASPYEEYEFEVTQIGGDLYEPNNTRDTYTVSNLGKTNVEYLTATLHNATDEDWYLLSPYTPGYFELVMNKMPANGYQMKLYNEVFQEVGTTKLVNGKPVIADVFGKKGTRYYLIVFSANGLSSNNPYEIFMNIDNSGLSGKEAESNDSFDLANKLTQGVDMLGSISSSADRDYYKLTSYGAGIVHFSLEVPSSFHDYNIVVYDEAKNRIKESINPGSITEYVLDLPVNNSVYYVMVYPSFGAKAGTDVTYRLKAINKTISTDRYENNDTIDKATEASVSTGIPKTFNGTIHAGTDVDFYKVTNSNLPYDLQLSLTGIPAGANYDVMVVDNEGKALALSKNGDNKDENFSVIIPKNKTYYVKVFSSNGAFNKDQAYNLTVKNGGVAPIIIVPGFGGTALFGNDPTFFGVELNLWMNINVTNTAKFLRQNYYSDQVESQIGAHFRDREGGLWDIADVAPEYTLGGGDIYFEDMINDLKAEGYVAGSTLFGLPYNFIRDNTEAADSLKRRIDLATERSGSSKVMLISHSNGGLVIKEAVADANYAKKVGKWVTLGTPWLGAPASMKAWIDGYDLDIPILSNEVGRELAMHSPSAYGLLPSPAYFEQTVGEVLTYYKKNSDVFRDYYPVYIEEYSQMADFLSKVNKGPGYLDFQEDLLGRVRNKHAIMYDWLSTDIPLYIIFGDQTRTIGGYTYERPVYDVSELANYEGRIIPKYAIGDGTVPLISSRGNSKIKVGTNNTTIYRVTGVTHMPLVKDQRNRQQVKQILIYGNDAPVADLTLHDRYDYTSLAYETGKMTTETATATATATETASDTPEAVTATVFAVPLTGAESIITLTLQNGEKTVIKTYADNTYSVDKQANGVTIDNLGTDLWIAAPVDQGTVMSWTGAHLTGVSVYDLQNSEYKTSYDVQVSSAYKSFTVSNSVAQPNKWDGVSVQEKPVYDQTDSGLEEYESVDEESGLGLPEVYE